LWLVLSATLNLFAICLKMINPILNYILYIYIYILYILYTIIYCK
jgi:hypothetical protein